MPHPHFQPPRKPTVPPPPLPKGKGFLFGVVVSICLVVAALTLMCCTIGTFRRAGQITAEAARARNDHFNSTTTFEQEADKKRAAGFFLLLATGGVGITGIALGVTSGVLWYMRRRQIALDGHRPHAFLRFGLPSLGLGLSVAWMCFTVGISVAIPCKSASNIDQIVADDNAERTRRADALAREVARAAEERARQEALQAEKERLEAEMVARLKAQAELANADVNHVRELVKQLRSAKETEQLEALRQLLDVRPETFAKMSPDLRSELASAILSARAVAAGDPMRQMTMMRVVQAANIEGTGRELARYFDEHRYERMDPKSPLIAQELARLLQTRPLDLPHLKALLEIKPPLNQVMPDGDYPLIAAVGTSEALTLVALMLENGADLKVVNRQRYTALIRAATVNNLEVAKLLIEKGADVNQDANASGGEGAPTGIVMDTALMVAVTKKDRNMVQLLLDHGANVNHENVAHRTTAMDMLRLVDLPAGNDLERLLLSKGAKTYNELHGLPPTTITTRGSRGTTQPATRGTTLPPTRGTTQPATRGTTQPVTRGTTLPATRGTTQPRSGSQPATNRGTTRGTPATRP